MSNEQLKEKSELDFFMSSDVCVCSAQMENIYYIQVKNGLGIYIVYIAFEVYPAQPGPPKTWQGYLYHPAASPTSRPICCLEAWACKVVQPGHRQIELKQDGIKIIFQLIQCGKKTQSEFQSISFVKHVCMHACTYHTWNESPIYFLAMF